MAVWKIAPGENAEDWDDSQDYGCIALGWMELPDYRVFNSRDEVLQALIHAYPDREVGFRGGAATSIWCFTQDVQIGDVLVANQGRSRVVGIGVIESDYLPPDSPDNPIPVPTTDDDMWRRQARRVNWRIAQEIDFENPYFFGIGTVTSLTADRVQQIRQAYLREHPELREILDELLGDVAAAEERNAPAEEELSDAEEQLAEQGIFDPEGISDARNRIVCAIVQRRGQSAFRDELLAAYQGRCLVTGCDIEAVLEAAHIIPYQGADTNHLDNGLLLRADIHTLFDLNLLGIEPDNLCVELHPDICGEYANLAGRRLLCEGTHRPSREALRRRYGQFQRRRERPL